MYRKRRCKVSALVTASPELKRLWIRVLKRVHPDLAVDEQDRRRCERLTQEANDAYARRDEVALRAVLEPKGAPLPRHTPPDAWEARAETQPAATPQSAYQPPPAPQQAPIVSGREEFVILLAACAVLCLLLYGIFDALSEKAGRSTSLSFLVLLTVVVLWSITRNSRLSYNLKARWVATVAAGMILVGICVLDSRPGTDPLFLSASAAAAQVRLSPVVSQNSVRPLPSQWYWEVIKTRVGQSWNPASVVDKPAGAIADIAFTISRDGSPRNVRLHRPSGSPSLDSSCVLAVQEVRTFGPPEGGARESLDVLYPCSYHELDSMNAHSPRWNTAQKTAAAMSPGPEPVEGSGSRLGAYIEAAKNQVAQKWNSSEVAGSTPAGATVYIQFAIRRRGNHGVPTMETSSGYASLDVSCLQAVDRIRAFDHLPRRYSGDSLTVLYHCTYPGSAMTKFAQDSIVPPMQKPSPYGPVDGAYDVQQPTSGIVVTN
jgi:TonB family protein